MLCLANVVHGSQGSHDGGGEDAGDNDGEDATANDAGDDDFS